jgi:putative transcriptional regulator
MVCKTEEVENMDNTIKKVREALDLSQEQLATDVGISRQFLSRIETGKSNPTYPIAYRLSKRLCKPIEEIFFNNDGNHSLQINTQLL